MWQCLICALFWIKWRILNSNKTFTDIGIIFLWQTGKEKVDGQCIFWGNSVFSIDQMYAAVYVDE